MQDYFIFNDIKSTNKNIVLLNYKPIFLPVNNRKFKQIPGRDGSIPTTDRSKQDIIIECEVSILGDSEEEVNKNIELAIPWLSERGNLIFWDMLDRYYIGEVVGETPMDKSINWNTFILQFRCHPIKYGNKIEHIIDNDILINEGSYKTKGIITIEVTENIDHIQVTLQDTGEYIYLGHNFAVGDTVVIDLEKEIAYKNGYSVMKDCYLESDFFEIPPGEFRLTTNTGNATLEYIERWL